MKREDREFLSGDGKTMIHVRYWVPDGEPKGILQLVHGMAEFIERYDEYAAWMAERDWLVVGHDHLGHGDSVRTVEDYGYFGENGLDVLLKDIDFVRQSVQAQYPGVPHFLLGHSMGSFLVRDYAVLEGTNGEPMASHLTGLIVMGTGYQPAPMLFLGSLTARALMKLRGDRHRSKFLNKLVFGSYNRHFKPSRTPYDWLTREEAIVDFYVKEKRCGFIFTVSAYETLFSAIHDAQDTKAMKRIPKNFPIFFVSGAKDPVGGFGEGVRNCLVSYVEHSEALLDIKLYEEDRHEILQEKNREEVFRDLRAWMEGYREAACERLGRKD